MRHCLIWSLLTQLFWHYTNSVLKLPNEEISYWKSSVTEPSYPSLVEDIEVDVAIVGGGIAGLTSAYLLKQSGLKVAVIEKNTIGTGTTGGTTGKVTSQHGLIYDQLKNRLGEKGSRIYAEAYQAAVERIAQLIEKEKIECDWQRDDNYVYTVDPGQVEKFRREAKAAAAMGLPASFEVRIPLPFKVQAAVKFTSQAKFHARKYVLGLAKLVNGQGSYVFEHSNVTSFRDGQPTTIRTKTATVTAKDIIVATKVPAAPLIARFSYAALEYPHTSYIVAGRPDSNLKGMYISPDKGQYSILPVTTAKGQLLLFGGENHVPGLGNPRKRQQKLADYAEEHFGISSIDYRWKAMDYLAYDNVPLIGKVYPWSKHLYTATGFKKWGLSGSMVGGTILRDLILAHANPWTPVFDSLRLKPVAAIPKVIADSIKKSLGPKISAK